MEGASPERISLIVIWEPVIPSDWHPPGRSVTAPLAAMDAQRFWDADLLASKSVVRTALKHPELVPEGAHIDETFVVWDIVALWPPGTRWETDLPFPAWFGDPVVAVEAELTTRLAAAGGASPLTP